MLKTSVIKKSNTVALVTGIIGSIALWIVAGWLMLALVTYSPSDPGLSWSSTSAETQIANLGGLAGAMIADVGISALGFTSILLPIVIALAGVKWLRMLLKNQSARNYAFIFFVLGLLLALLSGSGLENLYATYQTEYHRGGIAGYEVTRALTIIIADDRNATAALIAIFVLGSTLCNLIPWLRIFDFTGKSMFAFFFMLFDKGKIRSHSSQPKPVDQSGSQRAKSTLSGRMRADGKGAGESPRPIQKSTTKNRSKTPGSHRKEPVIVPIENVENTRTRNKTTGRANAKTSSRTTDPSVDGSLVVPDSEFPNTSILDQSEASAYAYSQNEIIQMGDKIRMMLSEFNVDVTVRSAQVGPVITQFEIEPAAGVKANQIINLTNDLARTLTVQSVRVVDNIPGTSYVGLEVPNKYRETVRLVDGLESDAYRQTDHPLTIVLGKDIRGETVISNLATMPHLLIAGTTGAGKSVCLNAILLSFLFKSSPDQLRLLMVDPKMLEFSVYEGIPHLLAPVITDMNQTNNALHWCISEMERRFALMAGLGVRNMENYNDHIVNAEAPVPDPTASDPEHAEPLKPFPYIVLVIDELSDLIMVMGKKAEELIIRIAQRARAAGIHLIVATQRPSTDVIRGVLKANIPTRIAFRVASNADSRTILDQTGAEHLLGRGDMLFIPPGSSSVVRVHGAFVSDDEVKRVVDHLKKSSRVEYDSNVTEALIGNATSGPLGADGNDDADDMYEQALDIISRSKTTSISKIQRELRIGYNRAARIIDMMEAEGVISAPQSGGVRAVLIHSAEH